MGVPNYSIERRLAVVPIVYGDKKPRVVLVTRSSGRGWTFPKGRMENGFTNMEQASVEAFEEAGIIGRISLSPIVATFTVQGSRLVTVSFYPFLVERFFKRWPECNSRERLIVSKKKAKRLLRDDGIEPINASFDWVQGNYLTMVRALPNADQIFEEWPVKEWIGQ